MTRKKILFCILSIFLYMTVSSLSWADNSCWAARNGQCDDGSVEAITAWCRPGTDDHDCKANKMRCEPYPSEMVRAGIEKGCWNGFNDKNQIEACKVDVNSFFSQHIRNQSNPFEVMTSLYLVNKQPVPVDTYCADQVIELNKRLAQAEIDRINSENTLKNSCRDKTDELNRTIDELRRQINDLIREKYEGDRLKINVRAICQVAAELMSGGYGDFRDYTTVYGSSNNGNTTTACNNALENCKKTVGGEGKTRIVKCEKI